MRNISQELGQWVSYQISEMAGCARTKNVGNIFPATDFKGSHKFAIPACIAARAWRTYRDAMAVKRSRHTRRMCNPQCCIFFKSPQVRPLFYFYGSLSADLRMHVYAHMYVYRVLLAIGTIISLVNVKKNIEKRMKSSRINPRHNTAKCATRFIFWMPRKSFKPTLHRKQLHRNHINRITDRH